VMVTVDGAWKSDGGTVAVICLVFTNVVSRGIPFHSTWDCCTKLLPITVSVKGFT